MNRTKTGGKILAAILSLMLVFSSFVTVSAEEEAAYVTVSVEKFTIGQGYFIEPTRVPIKSGDTCAKVVADLVGDNLEYGGTVESNFYVTGIKNADNGTASIPQYISDVLETENITVSENSDSTLSGYDYTTYSGWMCSINNEFPSSYMSDCVLSNGDVIRLQFSVYGWGGDLGIDYGMKIADMANKDELTALYAEIKENKNLEAIKNIAIDLPQDFEKMTIGELLNFFPSLLAGRTEDGVATVENLDYIASNLKSTLDIYDKTQGALSYLYTNISEPIYSSAGGEWTIADLARSDFSVPDSYYNSYYARLAEVVKNADGILSERSYTEYSRVIIALSSIGRDSQNIAGYDLIEKICDTEKVNAQGVNGAAYALIALNSGDYSDIAAVQAAKEVYLQTIISAELESGGYTFFGDTADCDLTAMVLQAIAPYAENPQVAPIISRCTDILSNLQLENGSFGWNGASSPESTAQVIIALCSIGVNPQTDLRFVKENNSSIDALLTYLTADGAFAHTVSGETNIMSTEQGVMALVAYNRLISNKNSFYDMSDAEKIIIIGDVNLDGVINSADAIIILQYYAHIIPEIDMIASDMDKNSEINAQDAIVALQIYAGLA